MDISKLSHAQKLEVLDLIAEKKRRAKEAAALYTPNEGQRMVHASQAALRTVFSGNGSGKCLSPLTKVLKHDGSTVFAKDIKLGDQLMGPKGESRLVTSLGSGIAPMYRISPTDKTGEAFECNDEHILSLQCCTSDSRYPEKKGDVVNISVKEFLKWPARKRRLFYGYRSSVEFKEQPLDLDPYILGIWLGDGTSSNFSITNPDPAVVDAFTEYAFSIDRVVRVVDAMTKADTYKATRTKKRGDGVKILDRYNLRNNKHIPKDFLFNTRRNRLLLLAGLIDTDGSLNESHTNFEITQASKKLSDDIIFLVRSLGFRITCAQKIVNGEVYYRMHIAGKIWHIPTRVGHKRPTPHKLQRNCLRYRIKIEPIGEGEYCGFTLDKDHLFLLSDFTVTHNTTLAANEAIWFCKGFNPITNTITKVPARVIVLLDSPDKTGDLWIPEINKWHTLKEEQLHKRGKPYITKITFDNGSEINFMFHDQNPLVFESIELDYLIADEPPPRAVYVALRRGARKKHRTPRFLLVGTPISGGWLRQEIWEPWSRGELTDAECFKYGSQVNAANLADGYIDNFKKILSEKEARIRLEGEFFDLEGLALSHLFKRDIHVIEPIEWQESWPVVVAIDPHTAKPHHAVMLGCDRDGYLYYIKELRKKIVAREFARELKDFYQGYRVIDIVSDSLGSSEYTSGEGFKSFIQVLKEEGVRVRATTWKEKSDEDFIERLRDAISIPLPQANTPQLPPKLRIFTGNNGIIRDIECAQFVKHRGSDDYKPRLDITSTDYLSCLKYALATNLSPKKAKPQQVFYNQPLTPGSSSDPYAPKQSSLTPPPTVYGFKRPNPKKIKLSFRPQLRTNKRLDDDW